MSFQPISPDDIETFTLETNPSRTFISSSTQGVSGTLNVFSRRSSFVKEIFPLSIYSQSFYNDVDLDSVRKAVVAYSGSTNKFNLVQNYISGVHNQTHSARLDQTQQIIRFVPPTVLNKNSVRKSVVTNNLMKFYRMDYPDAHFAFGNYHSVNFFTASTIDSTPVLMYPDPASGSYTLTNGFTFDFWINPRYTTDLADNNANFKAGTIVHLSSSYAVSLVTGSGRDINGYPNQYRILLQVSSSTVGVDAPSTAILNNGYTFMSNDNSLRRNNWHHVSVRWQSGSYQNTGSFVIDGLNAGNFVITASSISASHLAGDNPYILYVGNFVQGTNTGTATQALFFSTPNAQRDGVTNLVVDPTEVPTGTSFNHPLNAEFHDLKIYNRYLQDDEVESLEEGGPILPALTGSNLRFYLPPFFTRESPTRTFVGTQGGVLVTPFQTKNASTTHPFNTDFSFGIGGHYINLENFTKDFATGRFPRLYGLTASIITSTTPQAISANQYLYATGSNIARSLMILPNDNGRFLPNFSFMSASNLDLSLFIDDKNLYTPGYVSLRNYVPTSSVGVGLQTSGALAQSIAGPSPENLSASMGNNLTVFLRTRDASSNQVCFFDISNLYYGKNILPSSFLVVDTAMSNSTGKVSITLKDDGQGNLYRADCVTSQSTWNTVGNLFYNEGVAVIKHPSLYFFGQDQFNMNFRGVQNIHVLTFNCFKRALQVVSSSNPSYLPVSASFSDVANDTDQRFVYITGVNIHDEDLNVIAKTSLAQPVLARTGDKLLFKTKIDF